MNYNQIILPHAVQDIREINFSYKALNQKLAERFNEALKKEIQIIKQNPLLFQIRYDDFRVCKIEKFPYLIHYEINNKLIIINAVYHTSRDSKNSLNEIK